MSESAEYYRGRTDTILAEHSAHFERINGSIDRLAGEMHLMALNVQQLTDAVNADRALAEKTALAVKNADDARRARSDTSWTPFQRAFLMASTLAGIIGVLWGIFHH